MTPTVVAHALSKWFGPKVAVSEVDLALGPGVTGLLGPNGAGKTTLLRLLTGLQLPSQGSVELLGVNPRRDVSVYRRVSMVPEEEAVYADLTVSQFVTLAAQLSGIRDAAVVEAAIETVGLTSVAHRRLGGFSKGMRQRAKVATALVSDPEVLFLDEPLNGTDPVQRAHLIRLFVDQGRSGKTVVVSSHVLAEVERMADRVVAMVDGRLAAVGDVAAIRAAMTDKPRLVWVETDEPRKLASALVEGDGVVGVHLDGSVVRVEASDPGALAKRLPLLAVENDVRLTRVEPADESLESVFRYLVERR